MERKQVINENLIDQKIDEFIRQVLLPIRNLEYTEFSYDYDNFTFYLKFKDKLRPKVCVINSSYVFNKHTILRLSINNILKYTENSQEELNVYLTKQLKDSKQFSQYLNRLT